ncbi:hypothetical protein GTW40_23150 [Streptomyces sp. SID4985]|uniref:hypothetical protein n=1 Tax=Streptomyces sp. SID4985 TaxID=2690292 RepID=UPI00136DCC12|nr:hypothetical protein [Streptomyces sp. SID4985]MYQ47912.1 hypothetical protein [Streptomyces sp. SID4985]
MSPGDEHGYTDTARTRLRLPEDPYTHSPRRNSSRGLVTVVGVVVVLIAAIAFANRGDSPRNTTTDKNTPSGNHPSTSATSPTGTDPVGAKTGGIPTGYAHSRQGAESAAANYAVALGSAGMFAKAERDRILQTVMVPSRVTRSQSDLDNAYTSAFNQSLGLDKNGAAPAGSTFVSRTTPIGTKVTKAGPDNVTVAVWCGGLLGIAGGKSTNPVTNDWFTITMNLRWVAGDWKIDTNSQEEGPAPVPGDDKASGADEMSKAVEEYGGFTYAR